MTPFGNPLCQHDLSLFATPVEASPEKLSVEHSGAVTARKSLANPDVIISMIDGKPYKTLRRHISNNGLTPAEYRTRYGLKGDYPMTARSYSEARRAIALKIGLGSRGRQAKAAAAAPEPAAPAKRGRGRSAKVAGSA
uniref:MucR family transcriptional regulator n=1 Tax=uncultured Sphingomonas sp. TaxID=158754 RepID=UPI0035CC0299